LSRKVGRADEASEGQPNTRDSLYKLVVRALRAEILTGIYPIGTAIPSESQLVSRFGVSRHTITYRLLDGSVAEITFNRYPADSFSMSMNLKRVRS